MHRTARLLVLLAALALGSASSIAEQRLAAHAEPLADARAVAQAFYETYGEQLGLPDAPFVTLGVESGPGYAYEPAHNVLFVTPFRDADFDTQRHFARAASDDREAEVYNALMFRFFTAHECLHLLYDRLPMRSDLSDFERETRINVLTWLFLEQHGLLPTNLDEIDATLRALGEDVAGRFPSIRRGEATAATLVVDDNASYWYVTAASIREARAVAAQVEDTKAYATRIAEADRAAAAPAEAKL